MDAVRHDLNVAAGARGPDAQALADRLSAPLESAIRLALLDARTWCGHGVFAHNLVKISTLAA